MPSSSRVSTSARCPPPRVPYESRASPPESCGRSIVTHIPRSDSTNTTADARMRLRADSRSGLLDIFANPIVLAAASEVVQFEARAVAVPLVVDRLDESLQRAVNGRG